MRAIWAYLILSLVLSACSGAGAESEAEFAPTCIEDLSGHSVALPGGSSTDLLVSSYPGIDIMRVSLGDIPIAVKSGRADFGLLQEVQFDANQMARQGFKKYFAGILRGSGAIAFRKDDVALCDEFNHFLRAMKASGEYDRWYNCWLHNLDSMTVEAGKRPAPQEGKKLIVGITLAHPYIFLQQDAITGIEPDLMNLFCRSAGYSPEYVIIQFPALIPSLNANKIDLILSHLLVTPERAKQVLFSDEYMEGGLCCFGVNPKWGASGGQGIWTRTKESIRHNLIEEDRWKLLGNGLIVTLELSLLSLLVAILLGILLCYLRIRPNAVISGTTRVFVDVVRGIPVLVILMIMFYVIFAKVNMSGVAVSIFGFGLFFGACFSEVFRSGMMSVDNGQWEAGAALGLNKMQTFRLVAFPQALRRIIPVFKGEVIALIKSTSIVGYVAVLDLTCVGDIIRTRTLDAFFPLILVSIIYIILSRLSGGLLDALDRKLNASK
jgi:polar amino acid transport system substrate-binding protein